MGSLGTILGNTLTLLLAPMQFADGSLDLTSGSLIGSIDMLGTTP